MTEATPVVEMRDIKKSFAAVQALRGVDLTLHHGEVLGLMGDNAAGKSTLMKVLSGAYIPEEGEILIEGAKVHMSTPLDARRLGIEMVYQDLALANNLDVTANIFLGRETVKARIGPFGIMDSEHMEQEADRLLDRLKIQIPSGKTTLLNMISGLYTCTSGVVTFNSTRVEGLPSHQIARLGVGRTFQNTHLFRDLTVWENVETAARVAQQ